MRIPTITSSETKIESHTKRDKVFIFWVVSFMLILEEIAVFLSAQWHLCLSSSICPHISFPLAGGAIYPRFLVSSDISESEQMFEEILFVAWSIIVLFYQFIEPVSDRFSAEVLTLNRIGKSDITAFPRETIKICKSSFNASHMFEFK